MQKVLVTGGTGYIGSHTVVELQNKDYGIVVIDDLSNSNINVLDKVKSITGKSVDFYQFNLQDYDKLKAVFKENDIAAIIHFAASKAVGESVEKPVHYYQNNLGSMLNLLKAMQEFKVSNFVFSSSCTVYGQPDKLPVTEATPVLPAESPYGNTKQIGEEVIKDTIHSDTSLKAISLRYFNPTGAHESGKIGELPLGVPANLVPFITQTAAGIRESLAVFGDDYNTPDGSCIRDYIHVVDLAKAHVIAIERLLENRNKQPYEVFNLGTGKGNSVLEIINSFEKVTGQKLNYKIVPRREGDIEQIYADTTLATNELGWTAALGIDDMMRSAWEWQKSIE